MRSRGRIESWLWSPDDGCEEGERIAIGAEGGGRGYGEIDRGREGEPRVGEQCVQGLPLGARGVVEELGSIGDREIEVVARRVGGAELARRPAREARVAAAEPGEQPERIAGELAAHEAGALEAAGQAVRVAQRRDGVDRPARRAPAQRGGRGGPPVAGGA